MFNINNINKYANLVSYNYYMLTTTGNTKTISRELLFEIENYFLKYHRFEWLQAFKDNHNYYQKLKRLKDRINHILCLPSVFLTLTFNNETLLKTSEETRRKYVQRFLKSFNVPFVANRDYGSKNGREHYHAVIASQDIDYLKFGYGAVNGEKIVYDDNNNVKLSKYLIKLTNHATKSTTKFSRIMYSR